MSFIGNVLWFLFGGFWQALSWFLVGILWSITIVGLPVGKQCFKLGKLALSPFGKTVEQTGGTGSVFLNILWLVFGGIPIAVESAFNGIFFCITIIGIPFGKQCFKMAGLALTPFGAKVRRG